MTDWLRGLWRWLKPRLIGPTCEACGEWLRGPNTMAAHRDREHAGDPPARGGRG